MENLFKNLPEFLTEYDWSIEFNSKCDDATNILKIFLDIISEKTNMFVKRVKTQNNGITVYYLIPKEIVFDVEGRKYKITAKQIFQYVIADYFKTITLKLYDRQHNAIFGIENHLIDKKPTWELVNGSMENKLLELIVHYETTDQVIL